MEQRVSLITLGVADLQRACTFYEQLGWRGQQVQGTVFFQAGGLVLALWGRADLDRDIGIGDVRPGGYGGVALAQNVRSAAEVDEVITRATQAGATVTRPAAGTFYGGYAG
jgi:catechol 2,3-dioxygenase-like lactoylglutathione lyase family enzyme